MRRLRRRMDHQLKRARSLREHPINCVEVTNVDLERTKVPRELAKQALGRRCSRGGSAEELGAHVIFEPDDVEPCLDEMPD